ncbi:hypothetical protein ZIOFF_028746 [Zingiber officinale]|uniref:SAM-dependent MTase RsmB/NOP-type domain-containing protein n=1 Tax=Zingiber officinale TaxID=94328 RepID=A0A8J5GQD5_ZINOF|nr:hypothetical protein ZIOFF_028746 [Zingiber officinale]
MRVANAVPAVERVVYSTCSVYQTENEDVIKSVLPFAKSLNFELVSPFPQWPHRGLPVFDGAEHLLRTNPKEDTEGFFIALFVRKSEKINRGNRSSSAKKLKRHNRYMPYPFCKLSAFWFHKRLMRQGSKKNEALKW